MSYASLAAPTSSSLVTIQLPIEALRRHLRLGFAIAGMLCQCAAVAAVLWAILAAPGILADRGAGVGTSIAGSR